MMYSLSRCNDSLLLIIDLFLSDFVKHLKEYLLFILIALYQRSTNKCTVTTHLLLWRLLVCKLIIDLNNRSIGLFFIIVSVNIFLGLL